MELISQAELREFALDLVHRFRNDQTRAISLLGKKVTHGPPNGSGHANRSALMGTDRELSIDSPNSVRLTALDAFQRFLFRHIQDDIPRGVHQIFDFGNRLE
jgi:hypothetical protein